MTGDSSSPSAHAPADATDRASAQPQGSTHATGQPPAVPAMDPAEITTSPSADAPVGSVLYAGGRFSGQTIRTHLFELQKADRGRKFATKDRRPLDPPPVVQIRFYRVLESGTSNEMEEELEPKDVQPEGLLCGTMLQQEGTDPENQTTKSSEVESDLLFGSTVVQCVRLTHHGQDILAFVFADLSVKREGFWRLHYKAFDVLHSVPGVERPVLAECTGGAFQVYANRQFPGLTASTELTKAIARSGIRTNHRQEARVRGKNSQSRSGTSQHRTEHGDEDPDAEDDNHRDDGNSGSNAAKTQ